jgi:uncharacterized protein DUF4926
MIRALDTVVLRRDVPENSLVAGDVGAVVHSYQDGGVFEVEFVTAEGQTIGLLTLSASDIRPIEKSEILHARNVEAA